MQLTFFKLKICYNNFNISLSKNNINSNIPQKIYDVLSKINNSGAVLATNTSMPSHHNERII